MMLAQFQFFPEQASTSAAWVDGLLIFLLCVTGFFAVMIATLVIGFAVKYRRRPGAGPTPRIKGSPALEGFWSGVPLGLARLMSSWGAGFYFRISRRPSEPHTTYVF